jgi:hypothetical protein
MSDSTTPPGFAWQPFTPRGVAAFSTAPWGRLLAVQGVVALLCGALAVWFVSADWLPVAREALGRLPAGAAIRGGVLRWNTNTPVRLAENRFLALVVDAKDAGMMGRVADLEIALHERRVTAASILGYVQMPYPAGGWVLSLDPAEAIPWWGAWEWPLRAVLGLAVMAGLMILWFALATVYCPAVWLFGFFANRWLGLAGSWKLSGAALMPGALVMGLGLFAYGALGLDLIRLGLVFVLHLVTAWVYLVASPFFLPLVPDVAAPSENPFAQPGHEDTPAPEPPENPFAPRR